MNLPNTLTVLRILMIPFFVITLTYGKYALSLILFIAAALTDALDGFIARIQNKKTAIGKFLDPLADKALVLTSFIIFAILGWIPKWLAITVISRDVIIVVGSAILYIITGNLKVSPSLIGKATTFSQLFLAAILLLLVNLNSLKALPSVIIWITGILTIASGIQYIYRGFRIAS